MSQNVVMPYRFAGGDPIMWQELGRNKLTGAGDDCTVTASSVMPYLMVLTNAIPTGAVRTGLQMGNGTVDTNTNYCQRFSNDFTNDYTHVNLNSLRDDQDVVGHSFSVSYLNNVADQEKYVVEHEINQNTAGAGTAPISLRIWGKWADNTQAVDVVNANNRETGDFASDTEVILLGADPSNTGDGFWEELDTVSLGAPADSLTTNSFTAKKYLWIMCNVPIATAYFHLRGEFNGISTSTYADKYTENNGTGGSQVSQSRFTVNAGSYNSDLISFFVMNDSTSSKLILGQEGALGSAGAGSFPRRFEFCDKWSDNAQVTSFRLFNTDTGTTNAMDTGTKITVWGSD